MAKNTICLWYDKDAEAAARFYAATFPDSAVGAIHRAPSDYPSGKAGDVLVVEFRVAGVPCVGLNGGPVRNRFVEERAEELLDLFEGIKGHRPKTEEELDKWLASSEGKAATLFNLTSLSRSGENMLRRGT